MSSLEGTACPACRAPLVSARLDWTVLACNACGGVWTDNEAADRITTVVDRDLVEVAKLAAKHADEERPSIDDAVRTCPVCDQPLAHVRRGGVALDACEEHGTWFDRDELGRVARNLDYERKSIEDLGRAHPNASAHPESLALILSLLGD